MTYTIYIDIQQQQVVSGPTNSQSANLPPMVQGDTLNLSVQLLMPTGTFTPPIYSIVPVAGMTLQMALGVKQGNTTTYYATQFTWTPDGNNFFNGTFALNTSAITSLIGAAASAQAWLEIKYVQSGVPTTVFEQIVTINAAVIKAGGVGPVPPGQTPASVEYCNATFLARLVQGPITLVSQDGTKQVALYVANDGTFHADPLT